MTIAAFDFDGTLTTKDTLMVFLKFVFKKSELARGLLVLAPTLIAFKLKLMNNNKAKEKLFAYFFKGMDLDTFNDYGRRFSTKVDTILNPDAMKRLKWHQEHGHTCLIVSASIENWVTPWALTQNLEVASTRAEVADGKLTGKFAGNNCYGKEKVARLLALYPDRGAYQLYAYGDSNGDKALLKLADFKYYQVFE